MRFTKFCPSATSSQNKHGGTTTDKTVCDKRGVPLTTPKPSGADRFKLGVVFNALPHEARNPFENQEPGHHSELLLYNLHNIVFDYII